MPRNRDRDLIAAIGSRMRARRHWAGMTLQQVAEKVAVRWQQIQKYESGLCDPPSGTLIRIALALQTTPDGLLLARPGRPGSDMTDVDALLSDKSIGAIIRRLRAMDSPQRKLAHALVCTIEATK